MRILRSGLLASGLSFAMGCGVTGMPADGSADGADVNADRGSSNDVGNANDTNRTDAPASDVGSSSDAVTADVSTTDVGMAVDASTDVGTMDSGSADVVTTDASADAVSADVGRRGPAPVELGVTTNLAAAGAYVLLAKTGITNVTGSLITGGHLGLSPAAATFITGFSLIADSTTTFSTSVSVATPGRVYASNYGVPTPTNLTTAVLQMEAAYRDAAGRTTPDFLNLASGHLAGRTLTPGLYNWGTAVDMAGNVTIAGGSNDVWIFQISNDLDVSAARRVILSGGAQARNIFWQVAGQATIHANAHFEGIILSRTGITLQTNASMHGRALAQTLIALDNNAVTAP